MTLSGEFIYLLGHYTLNDSERCLEIKIFFKITICLSEASKWILKKIYFIGFHISILSNILSIYYDESKVLNYFSNVRHDSATPEAFIEVVKVTKEKILSDDELAWYSPNTRVSQKFFKNLVTWGTIPQLLKLLSKSWRWRKRKDCRMMSSPDTLRILGWVKSFSKIW